MSALTTNGEVLMTPRPALHRWTPSSADYQGSRLFDDGDDDTFEAPSLRDLRMPPASPERLASVLGQLEKLTCEYAELERGPVEEEAQHERALQEFRCLREQLSSTLRRYHDVPPTVEELLRQYDAEVEGLTSELGRLQEEHVECTLPRRGDCSGSTSPGGSNAWLSAWRSADSEGASWLARAPTSASFTFGGQLSEDCLSAVPSASHALCTPPPPPRRMQRESSSVMSIGDCQQLVVDAQETWRCRAALARRRRRTRADEWRLRGQQQEMQRAVRAAAAEEKELKELKRQVVEAEDLVREALEDEEHGKVDLERERHIVAELHAEVLALREACIVPAELKRKGAVLVSPLDREGGRLTTDRCRRAVQTAEQLCGAVSADAPQLRPLASRALLAVEEGFTRYTRLQQSHERLVRGAHLAVMRGVLASDSAASSPRGARAVAARAVLVSPAEKQPPGANHSAENKGKGVVAPAEAPQSSGQTPRRRAAAPALASACHAQAPAGAFTPRARRPPRRPASAGGGLSASCAATSCKR
eukprot:TRINITY_DN50258_c0_g1_i1.p1 TRINITY_DN50258_c0_g1~~TRINITY_DN50258_c0_g1_i1.p1  ORF type:complete len:533 (-),score=118.23 TRINITY_DN50258_c0_g1_i1:17-1615(-)